MHNADRMNLAYIRIDNISLRVNAVAFDGFLKSRRKKKKSDACDNTEKDEYHFPAADPFHQKTRRYATNPANITEAS